MSAVAPVTTPARAPMRVTLGDLKRLGACSEDAKFEREFGSFADVTAETLARAFAAKINVDWWARQVFGSAYEEATATAWRAYEEATATAILALAAARP